MNYLDTLHKLKGQKTTGIPGLVINPDSGKPEYKNPLHTLAGVETPKAPGINAKQDSGTRYLAHKPEAEVKANNWRNGGIGTVVGLGVGASTYAGLGMLDSMRKQRLLRALTSIAAGSAAGYGAYRYGNDIQAGASKLWNTAFGKTKK